MASVIPSYPPTGPPWRTYRDRGEDEPAATDRVEEHTEEVIGRLDEAIERAEQAVAAADEAREHANAIIAALQRARREYA